MTKSKLAVCFGALAVVAVVVIGLSTSSDNGAYGILIESLRYLFEATLGPAKSGEVQARPPGLIQLSEPGLRLLLSFIVGLAAMVAGLLSVSAAAEESNSLWYSLALFFSATAIGELSYIVALLYIAIFAYFVMRSRQWRMTTT